MDRLAGKQIVILGLARQGQALARFAAEAGARVIISDLRPLSELDTVIDQLRDLEITYVLEEHPLSLLEGTDLLAISGGVPATAPLVVAACERGIPVTNDSLEFVQRSPAPVIGITGSAGKTTTTALTGAMGRAGGRQTWVGGNIGQPLIAHLDQIVATDLVVQELSSFQLEIWSPEWGHRQGTSPAIAAVTNITPNHLDRHKTMEAYTSAKANIVRFQKVDDVAVLCADDAGAMSLAPLVRGRLRTYSSRQEVADGAFVRDQQIWLRDGVAEKAVGPVADVRLRGPHNVLNALGAATLADTAGIPPEAIQESLTTFSGVAHRLEVVETVRGVQYINDSIATAPERALAALESFDEPLILLAGGRDKEMVWERWAACVVERVRHVVLFGELAPLLATKLETAQAEAEGNGLQSVTHAGTVAEAVAEAARLARPGDIVLLSPGGTSYDAYRDFEERGEEFRSLVRQV